MNLPPLVAQVRIRTDGRAFRLWIPLFLLWLLIFALLLPVLVLAMLAALLAPRRWRFGRVARGSYAVLCETRGTHVEVERARTGISIALH